MLSIEERPKLLSDVIGHSKIIGEFVNRSTKNIRYPQVILLTGLAGSGKNTIAYILAKTLNCQSLVLNKDKYYEPCNVCASCKDINNDNFGRDTAYIDCSSYNSADVDKLYSKSLISPMYDRNKVFILDEFQYLGNATTKGKTNRLLEKPRKNVYFILCAKTISNVPNDLIQRCQKYNLYPIDTGVISEYLLSLTLDLEDIPDTFYTEGLITIAQNSQGSVRQSLQHLERCINAKLFSSSDIEKELGFISEEKEYEILFDLLDKKNKAVFDLYMLKFF